MTSAILCCGEALIDMLPRESMAGEPAFAPLPGGAVFNTAIALGRLGQNVGLVSGISNDLFGQMLMAALEASDVQTSGVITSARPTTLAFVTLTDGQARYAFYDENTAGRMLTVADLPVLPASVDTLFFGGISLAVEPCGGFYEALMLREAGTRVTMLDPNIRPSFIGDEGAFRMRINRMIGAADIVKLSDEDLSWLMGEGQIALLAAQVLAMGPKVLFITEGAKGAHAFTAQQSLFCPAQKVEVADTVGAGDTFNAGVLAALAQAGVLSKSGLSNVTDAVLMQALSLGVRAAAVTVSRAGANPPWARELL